VSAELAATAARLFTGVMAPLVVGGDLRPGHAIGARVALALGSVAPAPWDPELAARVAGARLRRARALVPVDALPGPADAEWALLAALHDLLQSANPRFDAPLRRRAATKVLDMAEATIAHVGPPANAHAALSRHTWFARLLEVARTDTVISFWAGSRTFLGSEPPARLQAWPKLRRVSVARTPRPLLKLAHPAGGSDRIGEVVSKLLACTPLTDLATCSRGAPLFLWTPATAGLVATPVGRALALRALARLPAEEVDAALGRAMREGLERAPAVARSGLALLGERAIAQASLHGSVSPTRAPDTNHPAAYARALGAAVATRALAAASGGWSDSERRRLLAILEPAARDAGPPIVTM
jgi:hypothetical protein